MKVLDIGGSSAEGNVTIIIELGAIPLWQALRDLQLAVEGLGVETPPPAVVPGVAVTNATMAIGPEQAEHLAQAAAPVVAPRRRRHAPAADASAAVEQPPVVISDADLSKAASNAAATIGPSAVMAVLETFGCKHVNELPQEKRRAFLDSCIPA